MSRLASALLALATAAAVAVAVRPAVDVTATVAFGEGYTPLFGFDNILRSADDRTVSLLLDRSSGTYVRQQPPPRPAGRTFARMARLDFRRYFLARLSVFHSTYVN